MAKAQFPIDGKLGKDFKVTCSAGPRINPVTHKKQFHNGTDIWSKHEPCWIEAPYAGKVIEARKSTAAGGGFGNFVILLHKIDGKDYTTLYAHMADGSLKVKKGQKVDAGTILGKMGTTGMSTGKHLHWELHKGKKHIWSATGEGYIEPIAFFKALIAKEKAIATAPIQTVITEDTPVAPAPVHSEEAADALEAARLAAKAAESSAPVVPAASAPTPPAVIKPVAKPVVAAKIKNPGYPGKYIKKGDKGTHVKYVQQQVRVGVTGVFDEATDRAVKALQKKHKLAVDGVVGQLTWNKLG
jgi:peptidoglycan hydrolase-like protein with peptidoglycan-binding domain